MTPGITVSPLASISRSPAGPVYSDARPAKTIKPSSITTVPGENNPPRPSSTWALTITRSGCGPDGVEDAVGVGVGVEDGAGVAVGGKAVVVVAEGVVVGVTP